MCAHRAQGRDPLSAVRVARGGRRLQGSELAVAEVTSDIMGSFAGSALSFDVVFVAVACTHSFRVHKTPTSMPPRPWGGGRWPPREGLAQARLQDAMVSQQR